MLMPVVVAGYGGWGGSLKAVDTNLSDVTIPRGLKLNFWTC